MSRTSTALSSNASRTARAVPIHRSGIPGLGTWPLVPTVVGGRVLVALVSLGDALVRSSLARPTRSLWYHLLGLELLSIALWTLMTFPALEVVRRSAPRATTARGWLLRAFGVG